MVDFAHKYSKMPEGWENSRLLQVFRANSKELSHEFKCYDTHIVGGGNYKIPSGEVLILLLQTVEKEELWTTIRRCTPSKYFWYKGITGYVLPMHLTFEDPAESQQKNLKALREGAPKQQTTLTEQQIRMDKIDDDRTQAIIDNSCRWNETQSKGIQNQEGGF